MKLCKKPGCRNKARKLEVCAMHREFSYTRRYKNLLLGAKSRSIPVDISMDEYLYIFTKYGNKCFYCDSKLEWTTGSAVDRINNKKGYTVANSVPCCGTCNTIKGDLFSGVDMVILVDFMKNVLQYDKKLRRKAKQKRRIKNGI